MNYFYIKPEDVQYDIDDYHTLTIYVHNKSLCTISDVYKKNKELDNFIDEVLKEHNYIVEE